MPATESLLTHRSINTFINLNRIYMLHGLEKQHHFLVQLSQIGINFSFTMLTRTHSLKNYTTHFSTPKSHIESTRIWTLSGSCPISYEIETETEGEPHIDPGDRGSDECFQTLCNFWSHSAPMKARNFPLWNKMTALAPKIELMRYEFDFNP